MKKPIFSALLIIAFISNIFYCIKVPTRDTHRITANAGNDTTIWILDTLPLKGTWDKSLSVRQCSWIKKLSNRDSIVSDTNTFSLVAPAYPCTLTYEFKVAATNGTQNADTVTIFVKTDDLFSADGGGDTTVFVGDSIFLHGTYNSIFPIAESKWQLDTSDKVTSGVDEVFIMNSDSISMLYRFIVTNSKGMISIDTVMCYGISDSSSLDVFAGRDIIAQPGTTVKLEGSYRGVGITGAWWSVNDTPFASGKTKSVYISGEEQTIPCIFKAENSKGISKSDTVFILINKKDSVWADAGPDMTVYTHLPIRLHGVYFGNNIVRISWQIGDGPDYPRSSGDTVFKAPSTVGKLPCIFSAYNGRVYARDTAFITVIKDPSGANGVEFSGMSVIKEKPSKITFLFQLLDDDGASLAIPASEMKSIIKIYERQPSSSLVFNEIDYSETSFFITEKENLALDICLVIDFTKSMENVSGAIDTMIASAKAFIDSLNEFSKVAVAEYHDRNVQPSVVAPLSFNHQAAKAAIDQFAAASELHGSSRVWDAVYAGISEFSSSSEKNRSLIVLTDGQETSSSHSVGDVILRALEMGVRIYPIAFGNVLTENYKILKALADTTGGAVYSAADAKMLSEMYKIVSNSLCTQYAVSYISLQTAGNWEVKITAEYGNDIDEYVDKVKMDAIYADDRIGEIVFDVSEKNIEDNSAVVLVKAKHVPRLISHFDFTLTTQKAVTIDLKQGLCDGWQLADSGNNHFRISSDEPIEFGKFGALWRMRISNIAGSACRVPFKLVNDYSGGCSFTYPEAVTIGSGGVPPVVDAGRDTTVGMNDTVFLHGSVFDPDGQKIVLFEWQWGAEPWHVTKTADMGIITPASVGPGFFICRFRATDEDGFSGIDSVRITIVSMPPVAVASASQTQIGLNDTIHLIGSKSTDNDRIVKYEWRFPNDTSWLPVSTGDTSFIGPSVAGNYTYYLRVTDADSEVSKNTASIIINVKGSLPIAVAKAQSQVVGLYDTISLKGSESNDKDGYIKKYEWKFNDGAWVQVATGDTAILPLVVSPAFTCSLRVTDDDDDTAKSFVNIAITKFTLLNDQVEFTARYDHSSVVFNNKLWVIGGNEGSLKNDVWYSATGKNWSRSTSAAAFGPRYQSASVVFNNKMWVIGGSGNNNDYFSDVWYSTDGITWDSATTQAAFGKRSGHACVVFNNAVWVIGGYADKAYTNDAWYSTDGSTWNTATVSGGFPARALHTCLVYNNKIWIIGGYNGGSRLNDVWYSSDGVTWGQTNVHAQFPIRAECAGAVYENKMWVIGGRGETYYKDIWSSDDGVIWTKEADDAGFGYKYGHSTVLFQNRIFVISGGNPLRTDVWYYKTP